MLCTQADRCGCGVGDGQRRRRHGSPAERVALVTPTKRKLCVVTRGHRLACKQNIDTTFPPFIVKFIGACEDRLAVDEQTIVFISLEGNNIAVIVRIGSVSVSA